jgi:glutathione peroxidase
MNFGVTFPLSSKVNVNGSKTHPVFEFVKTQASGMLGSAIKWNFTKFLVSPDGSTVKRYAPMTKPEDIKKDAEKLLPQ